MSISFRGDALFADHKCKEAAALYNDGKMRQEAVHFVWTFPPHLPPEMFFCGTGDMASMFARRCAPLGALGKNTGAPGVSNNFVRVCVETRCIFVLKNKGAHISFAVFRLDSFSGCKTSWVSKEPLAPRTEQYWWLPMSRTKKPIPSTTLPARSQIPNPSTKVTRDWNLVPN